VAFGLGDAATVDRIVVRWPGGGADSVTTPGAVGINRVIVWEEGTGPVATGAEPVGPANEFVFSLAAGAPNPFVDATHVRFELARDAHVTLRVFDVSGRRVRTLADGWFPRGGPHTVRWDGRDANGERVAAGVYFCRLETGVRDQSRRLVRIREEPTVWRGEPLMRFGDRAGVRPTRRRRAPGSRCSSHRVSRRASSRTSPGRRR
jgi:hypothetical protein